MFSQAMSNLPYRIVFFTGLLCLTHANSFADTTRVYHPYVDPLEKEFEFGITRSSDDINEHAIEYRLGYGQAITQRTFIEGYAIAEKTDTDGTDVTGVELELLHQLNERGSQWLDSGIQLELEREIDENIWEIGAALLLEKELETTSLAANLGLSYEFGSGIDNEYDRSLRLQWRYRYQPALEPALELYMDEYDKAAGPAFTGLWRLSPGEKLHWEAGVLFAIDEETPDTILRFAFEYEF